MDARIVPVLLGVLALVVVAGPASGTQACSTTDGVRLCFSDVGVSDETLAPDEEGTLSFTVTNEGNESVTFRTVLAVVGPNNESRALELRRDRSARTLAPGESRTFEQPLNPETVGTHGLQVRLIDTDRTTRYAQTDPVTVAVERQAGLGGPIDRTELAAGALVGALGVMGYLARRD